jgi:hypothetical protein
MPKSPPLAAWVGRAVGLEKLRVRHNLILPRCASTCADAPHTIVGRVQQTLTSNTPRNPPEGHDRSEPCLGLQTVSFDGRPKSPRLVRVTH